MYTLTPLNPTLAFKTPLQGYSDYKAFNSSFLASLLQLASPGTATLQSRRPRRTYHLLRLKHNASKRIAPSGRILQDE